MHTLLRGHQKVVPCIWRKREQKNEEEEEEEEEEYSAAQ